ncbi:MAG: hypothetical protein KDE61_10915, partial [Novosphingobium sp.]|nr:hypothetical protein [Novosphingobium sp.]
VSLNVAGIATFLVQGLPPRNWRITGGILGLWSFVLVLLGFMMAGRVIFDLGSAERLAHYLVGPL